MTEKLSNREILVKSMEKMDYFFYTLAVLIISFLIVGVATWEWRPFMVILVVTLVLGLPVLWLNYALYRRRVRWGLPI